MKRLRLIYVLISLAVADLGWLICVAGDQVIGPLAMLVGIPLILASVLVGIVYWLSLLWLVVAYKPQLIPVTAEKLKSRLIILLLLTAFNGLVHYQLRPRPRKSQLAFNDPLIAVQDSMNVLRQLCESVETDQFISCFIGADNTLFFSTSLTRYRQDSILSLRIPLTRSLKSLGPELGRLDTITSANAGFSSMKSDDAIRLLSVLKFLNRNEITGIMHDRFSLIWQYPYGTNSYKRGNPWFTVYQPQSQYIYVYASGQDTVRFSDYSTIRDRKGHMILFERKEAY